ncbi:MAG: methyltransferase [Paludibaculum sp.]
MESATVLPRQELVAAGLYRYVRHPIYLGDILLVAGYELALNSWGVLLVVPLIGFVWRKAAQEEALLTGYLPGYAA